MRVTLLVLPMATSRDLSKIARQLVHFEAHHPATVLKNG